MNEAQLNPPSQHDDGTDPEETVPDYHPLTREDLQELLLELSGACSVERREEILALFYQGIPGITIPRPEEGPVYWTQVAVHRLFNRIAAHTTAGDEVAVMNFVGLLS